MDSNCKIGHDACYPITIKPSDFNKVFKQLKISFYLASACLNSPKTLFSTAVCGIGQSLLLETSLNDT